MIKISNSAYLNSIDVHGEYTNNNPLLCYKSVLTPDDIKSSFYDGNNVASNMWSPDTFTYWKGESIDLGETQRITLNNESESTVNYIAIARHNLGSEGYSVKVEGTHNSTLTDRTVVVPVFLVSNDDAILLFFDNSDWSYFVITITSTSSTVWPQIAHIKMGEATILQRRIYSGHAPALMAKKVKRSAYGSESGQYLGQIVQRGYYTTMIKQDNNTPAFVKSNIVPFIKHVNGDVEVNDTAPATFFFAWRPTDYPDDVLYGWTNDNISPEITKGGTDGGYMSWSCNVEAIA